MRVKSGHPRYDYIDAHFIHDDVFSRFSIFATFDYSAHLDGRTLKDAEQGALRTAMPTSVADASCMIEAPSSPPPRHHSSPYEYLKTVEMWMVVAHQADSGFARLQSLF
jgi:hypothetical protein